ncbi:MAG: DUF58 domain-containing protein [Planctomycetota bacterium]
MTSPVEPDRVSDTEPAPDDLQAVLDEVRRIEVQSNRLVRGVMAGGYSSVFRGAGMEFEEVREFVEGDDPRLIDWKVTARAGRPFVKKFVDERELVVVFLLDLSPSMTGGTGVWSARQLAVRLCACMALAAVRNHDKVGMIAFAEGVERFVPPQKGRGHALRIVRDGLLLRAAGTRTSFAPALEYAGRVLRRRAVVFLVSDFLGPPIGPSLLRCAQRHDLVAVRILSPELFPPRRGLQRLRDPESGREVVADWSSEPVRAAWLERVASWRKRVDDELARADVDVMDVPVPLVADKDAVARPILRFFQMREQRGAHR